MIYLDYSATTPTDEVVLQTFVQASQTLFGNANSLHPVGVAANQAMESSTKSICDMLGVHDVDVIYTSGATEANNLAIKGIPTLKSAVGKHVILSPYEHSSVVAGFTYLEKHGFDVDILPVHENGKVDLDDLKQLLRKDTVFVSVCAVSSETGVRQDVEGIASLVKEFPNVIFHSDVTQAIGKIDVNYALLDCFSFSAHKFYGIKGIGALVKKQTVAIEPLIVGGHSTTVFRSGTPSTPLVVSMEKAMRLAISSQKEHWNTVSTRRETLERKLKDMNGIVINASGIPHILNLSVLGHTAKSTQEELAKQGIMVSTQTACSSERSISQLIYQITNSLERAKSSIRVSISHLTTQEEVEALVDALKGILTS